MTIEEAVQLVIQAGAIGSDGHALVLDMGDPVRIYDVARQLAASVSPELPIVFTGLRPGEKLHEDLFCDREQSSQSDHELIRCVDVPALDPALVRDLDPTCSRDDVLADARAPGPLDRRRTSRRPGHRRPRHHRSPRSRERASAVRHPTLRVRGACRPRSRSEASGRRCRCVKIARPFMMSGSLGSVVIGWQTLGVPLQPLTPFAS